MIKTTELVGKMGRGAQHSETSLVTHEKDGNLIKAVAELDTR